jgi:methionyl-tRNA formyltransferase
VKTLALAQGIGVLQPERARDPAFLEELTGLKPDLAVVAAYGQLLPTVLLRLPSWGCLNVHASLLPKYRGAAPIQWAMLNGDAGTGVTIMKIDEGLDTGDLLSARATPIHDTENAQQLHDRLADLGAALLLETIPRYVSGDLLPRAQPVVGVSYARKITKEDGRLQWSRPARELSRRVRALIPWPGAYTYLPTAPKPTLLKVWQAGVSDREGGPPGMVLEAGPQGILVACAGQSLCLESLQREGGRRMTAREFVAGHRLETGQRLL